jgi:O-antigen ligase
MKFILDQRLLMVLIILTPFHYFIFSILLKEYDFLKYWKEVVISITCLLIFTRKISESLRNKQFGLTVLDISILYFLIPIVFSFLFLTTDKSAGLYMFRVYIQPLLVYYIVRNINMTEYQFNKFTKIIFNVAIILSAYGLFQAIVLGDQFLISLGYTLKYEGRLLDSYYIFGFGNFQRVVSTFFNSNVCALYLSFSLIIVFMNNHIFTKRKLILGLTIILLAILFTFSRSTWIPLLFVLFYILKYFKNTFPSLRKIIILFPLLWISFLFIASTLFDLMIFERLYAFIYNSITLKDTSAAGRSDIWAQAVSIIKDNIFGIGMGHTGAKAMALGNDFIPSESSYLTILLDFGIQGLIPFLLIFISTIYISFKNINRFRYNKKIKLINIGRILATVMIMVSMLFSNYIHDIELFTIYYFLIGLGSNKFLIQDVID